ncbi:uncharacterized protein LOC134816771 isoform X2 [Bolinopsis microptera]|uniref:uncharacterized protein LOC134816771 isoform X2 n=1 Tax=Bolinopsis microptera TaxID=2820187 RepID=UPI00307A11BF
MTYKKQKGINPIGSVICFVVYVILCGQIITLIESQWLIVPAGLQAIVNRQNVDGQTIKVKSNSTAVGSCGLVGMCYPFHTGSILAEDLAVKFEKCRLYNNKVELGGQAGLIAISLYGVGLGFLTLSWIISICSCCHDNICGKNIFLVLTHFITLAFVMVGSGSVTWMFTWHDESCASVYCNATPLFKNNCLFGWSLWVLSAVIVALFCTMIALCAITKRHLSAVGTYAGSTLSDTPSSAGFRTTLPDPPQKSAEYRSKLRRGPETTRASCLLWCRTAGRRTEPGPATS